MTETSTLDTAQTATVYGVSEDTDVGQGYDVSCFWIVWAPALLVSTTLFVWGLWSLVGPKLPPVVPELRPSLSGVDLVGMAIVIALGPYGLFAAFEDRKERQLEEQFPDFLTDLASNRRAGFTLAESVRVAADSNYGPLTDDVRRMAAQLSWNMPFEEALERFANRVDTPLVSRSISSCSRPNAPAGLSRTCGPRSPAPRASFAASTGTDAWRCGCTRSLCT